MTRREGSICPLAGDVIRLKPGTLQELSELRSIVTAPCMHDDEASRHKILKTLKMAAIKTFPHSRRIDNDVCELVEA